MAKKAAANNGQTMMQGEGFPEPPPPEVSEAFMAFRKQKDAASKAVAKRNTLEETLIEIMRGHDLTECPIEGENKVYKIDDKLKIKIEKRAAASEAA